MKYSINGASVMLLTDETLVAGSVGVHYAEFVFDDTWDEYAVKMAVFKSDYDEREMLIEDNRCLIPWEVLQEPGLLHVGIYGQSSEKKRPTLWAAPKTVYPGASECEASSEPTPDKWQQAIAYIESLVSPTVEVVAIDGGHRVAVTDVNSTRFFDVMDGEDGYTPVKGVDYFDGEAGYTPVKGVDYFDGEAGYTPVKGVDYFDGEDGYTPVKGVDYFDGEDGYTPVKGVDYYTDADKAEMVQAVLAALPDGDEVSY
ncbi:MAG: hypothetical protein IJY93_00035 [Clostridia bacterium]|nr:hypothetical protein [Clostridia bacterium]